MVASGGGTGPESIAKSAKQALKSLPHANKDCGPSSGSRLRFAWERAELEPQSYVHADTFADFSADQTHLLQEMTQKHRRFWQERHEQEMGDGAVQNASTAVARATRESAEAWAEFNRAAAEAAEECSRRCSLLDKACRLRSLRQQRRTVTGNCMGAAGATSSRSTSRSKSL
jgi:hypothetical protein